MADLLTAAKTQIRYAANELRSGDKAKALEHLDKAEAFIERANASTPAVPPDEDDPVEEPTEDESKALSTDARTALSQLLAAVGHPVTLNDAGETISADPAAVADAADETQEQELALLGFFGVGPDRFDADHSLRDKYYSNGGTTPKDPDIDPWADYIGSK